MISARNTRSLAVPGHFGELLQGRLGPSGPVALVTLPCPDPVVSVAHVPNAPFALHVASGQCPVPPRLIRALLRQARTPLRGRTTITCHAPPGAGLGISTATLLGLARLHGLSEVPPETLAARLTAIEGATDPLMLAHPARHLWASREGRSLAPLPAPLPLDIVGGLFGPPCVTDPADSRFPDIADLAAAWPEATTPGALAALATESARRTVALRDLAPLDPLERIAARTGAIGLAIAHTGSARALLFAPGTGARAEAAAALRSLGLTRITRFRLSG